MVSCPEEPAKSKFNKDEMVKISKQQFSKCIQNMLECIPILDDLLPNKRTGAFERYAVGILRYSWKKTTIVLTCFNCLLAYDDIEDVEPAEVINLNGAV